MNENEYVYLLQHSTSIDECLETKIIGIYSTHEQVISVIEKYKNLEGFKKYKNHFFIDKYPLNESFWMKGFFKDIIEKYPEHFI